MAGISVYLELLRAGLRNVLIVNANRKDTSSGSHRWTSTNQHYADPPGMEWKLGGRTDRWHGVVLPIEPPALDCWPAQVRENLIEPSPLRGGYRSVLDTMTNWKGAKLDTPMNSTEDYLTEQLREFSVTPRASFTHTDGFTRTWTSFSPLDIVYNDPRFDDIADRISLNVLDATTVLAIRQHRGLLRLHCRPTSHATPNNVYLDANAVVLAAGTLESTRIMAQSLTSPHTNVWENLATKIKHGIIAVPPNWMTSKWNRGDRVLLVSRRPDLQANLFIEILDDRFLSPLLDMWWMAEQSTTERATITFQPPPCHHELGAYEGKITADIGPHDLRMIQERDRVAIAILKDLGCKKNPPLTSPKVRYRDTVREVVAATQKTSLYLNPLGYTDHESCTLAIGTEIDASFMSYRIPGLFVAGPSTFPRTGAANPGLTILSTARPIATAIHKHLYKK